MGLSDIACFNRFWFYGLCQAQLFNNFNCGKAVGRKLGVGNCNAIKAACAQKLTLGID